MSKQLVNTALPGFQGPIVVSAIKMLRRILEPVSFNSVMLMEAALGVPGFIEQTRPRTDDGYAWFRGHNFLTASGGVVSILIPWGQGMMDASGSRFDRLIGVYATGGVSIEEINNIVGTFALAFRMNEQRKRLPSRGVIIITLEQG
jgi:hypothetical protein